MIELRTFRNTDKAAQPGLKFLCLAFGPGGFAVQFYGKTQALARAAADDWAAAERKRGEADGLGRRSPPKSPKPQPAEAAE